MKILIHRLVILLTFAILFSVNSNAFARNIDIVNYTGHTIYKIFVSSNGSNDGSNWGGNILGSSVLKNGERTTLKNYHDAFGKLNVRIDFSPNAIFFSYFEKFDFPGTWRKNIYNSKW